jgi:hypothetical protein
MNDDERVAQLEAENKELKRALKASKLKGKKAFTSHDLGDVPPIEARGPSPILTTNLPVKKAGMLQTHDLKPQKTPEELGAMILERIGKGKPKGEKKDETQKSETT